MSLTNKIMKANYHTHMYLCNHATGNVEDYVKKAIELNFEVLGMSDHAPFIFLSDRSVRMGIEDYPIYLKELAEAIKKYSDRIKIYKGLEIEYFPFEIKHYQKLLEELDYLTLGQHYIQVGSYLTSVYKVKTIDEMNIYKDTLIEAMATGFFKFISHPDIFLFNQKNINRETLDICKEIIEAAKAYDVPLEINANGIRKGEIFVNNQKRYRYPRKEFWELVKAVKAKVIISADAHRVEDLFDQAIIDAYKFAQDIGLEVEEELVMN